MASLVVNTGKAIITHLLTGAGTLPLYISWGTGGGTTAAGNTTLFTESMSTTNDGTHNQRFTGTSSQTTTSTTNDTFTVTGTMTADATKAVTNAGLFDSLGTAADLLTAPSGGNLFCKADFATINLAAADQISWTLAIQFS